MYMDKEEIIKEGKKVLQLEANSILDIIEKMDESFSNAVELIVNCEGKVILTGTGKSGLIARKISATLSCCNIPSLFLNAYECLNGDLGVAQSKDLLIMISNSGETDILKVLLIPSVKNVGCKIIGVTGNNYSHLGKESDVVLNIAVKKEACPLGISATCSSTTTLAMGDALAMVAMKIKGTTREKVFFLHQGGAWGDKLKKEFVKVEK